MVNDPNTATQQHRSVTNTRRRFLGGAAGALGVAGVGTAFTMPVAADDDDEADGGDEPPAGVDSEFDDDVDILNFARTLEFLEASFYEEALDNIDTDDLCDVEGIKHFDDEVVEYVYDEIEVIQEHEAIHAEVLGAVVEDLGGDPVDEPEFEFGDAVEDPTAFIETAAVLEDTGVAAYAGAASQIEDADLVPPALSIHSVEGRHASFVRVVGGETGFPNAFDAPLSRAAVEDAIEPFLVD